MNWLQRLLCDHQWNRVYSYASMRDICDGGQIGDQSGRIEGAEECSLCHKYQSYVITIAPDGSRTKRTGR